eukprot:12097118-Heterocapsa_arctica.AAC.1
MELHKIRNKVALDKMTLEQRASRLMGEEGEFETKAQDHRVILYDFECDVNNFHQPNHVDVDVLGLGTNCVDN